MKRKIAANAAVLAVLRVGAPLCSLAIVLVISRRLGAEGLGRYSLAYAYLALFSLLGPLGLPGLLTREGARDRAALGRLLSSGVLLGGAVSLALTLFMAALCRIIGYDPATTQALLVLSVAILPSTCLNCFDAAFLALEDTTPIALAALAEHAAKVGIGLAALFWGRGLNAVLAAAVAGRVGACVVSLALLRRRGVRVSLAADFASLRALATLAPVFAASSVCATLYWRLDVFLLSRFRSVAEVGYYTAAYRLLDIAILPPQSLCQALYPRVAGDRSREPRWRPVALGSLALLTVPVALFVTLLARPLLRLLYRPDFTVAAPALVLLIWTAVPWAWTRYHAYLLVAHDRQNADLAINAAMLALNTGLNLALIPGRGMQGAAAVTLATALVYGLAQLVYLKRRALSAPACANATPITTALSYAPAPRAHLIAPAACGFSLGDRGVRLKGSDMVRETVQQFYDTYGWKKDERSRRYLGEILHEDLDSASQRYMHANEMRYWKYLAAGGRFFLDAGSGSEPRRTMSRYYHRHVCVDVSLVGLRGAREQLQGAGLYVVADLAALPFHEDSFDGVLASHSLYHVEKDLQPVVLRELVRVAKPARNVVVFYHSSHNWLALVGRVVKRFSRRLPAVGVRPAPAPPPSHPVVAAPDTSPVGAEARRNDRPPSILAVAHASPPSAALGAAAPASAGAVPLARTLAGRPLPRRQPVALMPAPAQALRRAAAAGASSPGPAPDSCPVVSSTQASTLPPSPPPPPLYFYGHDPRCLAVEFPSAEVTCLRTLKRAETQILGKLGLLRPAIALCQYLERTFPRAMVRVGEYSAIRIQKQPKDGLWKC